MKSTWRFILSLVVILTAILAIMMAAFALPAVHSGIHKVPIGMIEKDDVTYEKLSTMLQEKGFKVTRLDTEKEATTEIKQRKLYGAFSIDTTVNLELYKATAASATVAQLLTDVAKDMLTQQKSAAQAQLTQLMAKTTDSIKLKGFTQKLVAISGKQVKVTDVKSFPKADEKGSGLAAGALPIALGGWIGTVAISQLIKGKKQKFIAVIGFSIIGGLGLIAMIQFGIGTFDGNYLLTSLGAMLGIMATSFFVLGILEVLALPGLGIAAIVLILLGNPLSGLVSAPELLPSGWGGFGQLLPPGATGTLLRNIAFFEGHAINQPLIVLLAYVGFGMVLFRFGNKSE